MFLTNKLQEYIENNLASANININGDRPWDIQIKNSQFYPRIMLQGSLGLGESYTEKWWECEQLDQFFFYLLRGQVQEEIAPNNITSLWQKLIGKLVNLQTLINSLQLGKHHYDLGNDLFASMLDSTMAYSCGYWQDAQTLEESQLAKLDLICRKLNLQAGMNILDIGCGWGSFMKFAAENYGVSCVGLTVSREQMKLGEERCQGLPVQFIFSDYRQFQGNEKFDHIVSIGMFEHVGYKNYPQFMQVAHKYLKDDGLFLLHTIGNCNTITYSELWTNKYIFPHGMLPSLAQISLAAENYFVIEDFHNFGADYDLTLMAWLKNFEENWHLLKDKYGDKFYRVWKYFLCSCAGSFRARHIQLWQLILSKNGILDGYKSVRYL
jgi:cyclopropane-fatty-acyl-phospholipid synthase